MYDYGEGLPDDYVLAYAWYNLAAAQARIRARISVRERKRRTRRSSVTCFL